MSKYYAPDREEFYEGFLYEYNGSKDLDLWTSMSHSYNIATLFPEGAFSGSRVRVKHLDREDIESLGFELSQIPFDSFEYEYHLEIYGSTIGTVIFNKDGTIDELELYGAIFSVRNISELKKLLKQLGVL
jgi:hypothetical protein